MHALVTCNFISHTTILKMLTLMYETARHALSGIFGLGVVARKFVFLPIGGATVEVHRGKVPRFLLDDPSPCTLENM